MSLNVKQTGAERTRSGGGTPAARDNSGATWHDRAGDQRPAAAQHLRDLARLRRVRDRIDREYGPPPGPFSSRFTELVGVPPSVYRRQAARATAGMPSCVAKQVTRPIRHREAPAPEPPA